MRPDTVKLFTDFVGQNYVQVLNKPAFSLDLSLIERKSI